jgi:CSLREA domain-containing protein
LALAALGPLATPAPAVAESASGSFAVNTTGDTNVHDSVLSLREAILVANGTLTGPFTSQEQNQLGGCSFLAGNHDLSGAGNEFPDCSGALDSGGYNMIRSPTGCAATLTTGDLSLPAQLGPLQDRGGGSLMNAAEVSSSPYDPDNLNDKASTTTRGNFGVYLPLVRR